MPTDSPKFKEAEDMLPDALKSVYGRMVQDYEFLTRVRYGRGYVAYEVLAEMVLAGWRPSEDVHPSSRLAAQEKKRQQ